MKLHIESTYPPVLMYEHGNNVLYMIPAGVVMRYMTASLCRETMREL